MGTTRNGQSQSTLPSGPPKLGEQGAASSRIGPYSYVEDVYEKLPTTLELEKMLARDTQPKGLENALVLPVRQAPFEIEEAEGDSGEAEYCRDCLLKPSYQGGMTTPISAVIAQMTGAFARRRTFFEKVWEIGPDGKYRYHKLAFRRASTCSIIDDKNGSFNGFKQEGFLKDGTPFNKDFNPSKAFVYIHGFAPDDPLKGESAFDAAYQAHVNKMKIQFLQAMYLQKFGLPQTVIETDSLSEEEQKRALSIGEDLRGGGVAVFGPTMRLAAQNLNQTSNAEDFKGALEYLDNQMARSVLAQFLLLGQGSNTGAWALSKDHSDFFVISEEARLRQIEWHFDNYVLAPLVYYNFGESAAYPKLKFRPLSESAVEQALEMFKDLIARGQMQAKPALVEAIEEKVAQVLDIDPEKLKEEEIQPITSPTDNSPVNPEIQKAIDRLNVSSVQPATSAQPVAASSEDEAIELGDNPLGEPAVKVETVGGETIDFHLPGKHNQKDHGRLGIGRKSKGTIGGRGGGASGSGSGTRDGGDRLSAADKKSDSNDSLGNTPAQYSGSGISVGLDYSHPAIEEAVSDAIRSIEGVHGAPNFEAERRGRTAIPSMPVRPFKSNGYVPANGEYHTLGGGISIDSTLPAHEQMEVAVHEIGHWIAERGLGNGVDDATQKGSALKNFKTAAKESPSMERWKKGAGQRFNVFQDEDKYSKKMPEVFARAYTQWIALRTDGPFADAFRKAIPEPGNPKRGMDRRFWTPEEFELIAKALDADFKRAGWID